ncbi:calcium-binding protein [Salipiger mucosus]|uniref:Hemolysin-type calcium-binding protein region n=1 Tax=Salipiger mucosus DSM 16094 TaxID=1123237 RepID=S9RNV5_9RHOB|nr:hypothetical protein [Salipiger mucosus]EPX79770.1 Hemolysin-type calcium-binding protein region [Salipiger mucosus DSM 16094]
MAHLGNSFTSYETFLNRSDIDAVYTVDLAALNSSGTTGDALIAVNTEEDGSRYINVLVVADGLVANQAHPMHIHGTFDSEGNPTDAQTPDLFSDADGDGVVEVLEGVPNYGDVLLPLAMDGDTPMSDEAGQLVYINNFDLDDASNFFSPVTGGDYSAADIMPLELREIVIHGMDVPAGLGAGTGGEVDGTQDGYVPILPAAAGEIEMISTTQALDIIEDLRDAASANVQLGAMDDMYSAGPGDDTVMGGEGNDHLMGGADNDELSGEAGMDTLEGGGGADMLMGGEGIDWASYAGAESRVRIDMTGAVQGIGDGLGDTLTGIENVEGSRWADALWGDTADNMLTGGLRSDRVYGRDGDDTLDGGTGNDAIYGNGGADLMMGGTGMDRFIFFGESDSTPEAADRIDDFAANERIEISRIDADVNMAGNQTLSWIDDAAFSGTAGELRASMMDGDTVLQADTDGDGMADFEVMLTGNIDLGPDNFLL